MRYFGPIYVALFGLLVWIFIFLSSPLIVVHPINAESTTLLILSYFAFAFGVKLIYNKSFQLKRLQTARRRKIFRNVATLACIGILSSLIDTFLLRGMSLSNSILENREASENLGGNIVSIIGGLLSPSLFYLYVFNLKHKVYNGIKFALAFGLLFALFLLNSYVLGSRSAVIISVFILIFSHFMILNKVIRIKQLLVGSILIGGLFLFSMKTFEKRTKEFAGSKIYDIALKKSAYNFTLAPSDDYMNKFRDLSNSEKSLSFAKINVAQYYLHGFFEYSYLVENFRSEHTLGEYTFNLYFRMLEKVSFGTLELRSDIGVPRVGVFTSLFGPIFIDFGWFTPIFMFVLGGLSKLYYNGAKQGDIGFTLVYAFIGLTIFFAPVFNGLQAAGGLYILTNFVLFSYDKKVTILRSATSYKR